MSNLIDKELSAKLAATTCKKCGFCHAYTKMGFRCPYFHGLSEDMSKCKYFLLSSYYKRKEEKEKQSIALGKLIVENGIIPKYRIGQKVYVGKCIGSDYFCSNVREIAEIIPNKEGTSYTYRLVGHRTPYSESSLYETEQDVLIHQVQMFKKRTIAAAKGLSKRAAELGIALTEPNILALAGSNEENK